jgi:dUTP pyrophosphatase
MNKIELKFKKLHQNAVIPTYATKGSAGFDLYSIKKCTIYPQETVLISTGLSLEIPEGYELQIRTRSSMAMKYGVIVLNSPGTVDSDYRGEIKVILKNTSNNAYVMCANDRIAQGVIQEVTQTSFVEVNELSTTDRGEGGFGSTGK